MSFQNGMPNLTNWLGNVIMPTIAGLFAAAGIYRFGKARPWQHFAWAGLASLMCSGLLRVRAALEAERLIECILYLTSGMEVLVHLVHEFQSVRKRLAFASATTFERHLLDTVVTGRDGITARFWDVLQQRKAEPPSLLSSLCLSFALFSHCSQLVLGVDMRCFVGSEVPDV
ncbi:MAG: hypothetical protein WCD47_17530 [Candidatus Sulfotelmatobacter sp.]